MSDANNSNVLSFTVHPAGGGCEVPVSLLTQTLATLQELVHLFALQEEGRSLQQRLRLSEEINGKYVLQCSPPQPGSFAITGHVRSQHGDLFASQHVANVLANLHRFSRATVDGQADVLPEIIPDSRLRHRILTRLIALSPAPGSGYRYELFNGTGSAIALEETLPNRIESLLTSPTECAELQTVTGRLDAIAFGEHKLTIIYAPKRRALECFYDEDLEPMLLENRRDLIQVTGRVIMDDDNHPKRIDEVEQIRDLDLSPFVLSEVAGAGFRLRTRKSVLLQPLLSEMEQLICLEHSAWDLNVFAPTRGELFQELKEQVLMLWTEFARAADDALSAPARRVKEQLLKDWEELPDAKG